METLVLVLTVFFMVYGVVQLWRDPRVNHLTMVLFWQSGVIGSVAIMYVLEDLGVDLTETGLRSLLKFTLALCSIVSSYYSIRLLWGYMKWK